MEKRALVLGGGGAKGAYQLGIWRAIGECGMDIHLITGSSIGALNGALMTQGDYDRAVALWHTIDYHSVFAGRRNPAVEAINSRVELFTEGFAGFVTGAVDIAPFERLVTGVLDEGAVRSSPTDFGFTAVQVPLFRPVELMKEQVPVGRMADYLIASASCFPVFPPRMIGGQYYIDGGYHDDIPIALALRSNATEVVAVDLQSVGMHREPHDTDVPITFVRSGWDLGPLFSFDRARILRNIELGYLDFMKAVGRAEGRLYAFRRGEMRANVQRFRTFAQGDSSRTPIYFGRFLRFLVGTTAPDQMPGIPPLRGFTRLMLDAAEAAGRIFDLPPDRLYTLDSYHDLLMEAVGREHQPSGHMGHVRLMLEGTRGAYAIQGDMSARQRTLLMLTIFRENDLSLVEALYDSPAADKAEFSAAYYIYALENYLKIL